MPIAENGRKLKNTVNYMSKKYQKIPIYKFMHTPSWIENNKIRQWSLKYVNAQRKSSFF